MSEKFLARRIINLIGHNSNEYRRQRIYELLREHNSNYRELMKGHHEEGDWTNTRNYSDYNYIYRSLLPRGLLEYIRDRASIVARRLKVLDLGAGKGTFLSTLRKTIEDKKIAKHSIETTGLSLGRESSLEHLERLGHIDRVIYGYAEEVSFGEKYDLIFDTYGPNHYTTNAVRPYLFEITLSHLSENGTLFCAMNPLDVGNIFPKFDYRIANKMIAENGFIQFEYLSGNRTYIVRISKYQHGSQLRHSEFYSYVLMVRPKTLH